MSPQTEQTQSSRESQTPWTYATRWRIEGCLFTLTPLHIGSGEIVHHPDLTREEQKVEISAHTMDASGQACIFGSALKGGLRSWVGPDPKGEEILGEGPAEGDDNDTKGGSGGIAEFHDAPLWVCRTAPTPLPYWNERRQTWVETTNSIDRHTATAADDHLIHTECVPPGVGFHLSITALTDNDDHIAWLLAALEGFNAAKRPLTLGAGTASGKGRLRWEPGRIYRMDRAAVLSWVQNPQRDIAENNMSALSSDEVQKLRTKANGLISPHIATNRYTEVPITLSFDSHFLVNDPPSQREIDDAGDTQRLPDHRPRVDEMGCVILPAKSFRGAFRSQAERILRSLGQFACDPSDARQINGCAIAIEKGQQPCLACQLFGAPGWRTTVEIGDFRLEPGDYECTLQEFVAIDRFTGGGKEGAKFNAQAVYQPVFSGSLRIDTARIPPTGLGVLALTLRDLKEGDITFGLGAAKGYGTCVANIPVWEDETFQKDVLQSLKKLHGK